MCAYIHVRPEIYKTTRVCIHTSFENKIYMHTFVRRGYAYILLSTKLHQCNIHLQKSNHHQYLKSRENWFRLHCLCLHHTPHGAMESQVDATTQIPWRRQDCMNQIPRWWQVVDADRSSFTWTGTLMICSLTFKSDLKPMVKKINA